MSLHNLLFRSRMLVLVAVFFVGLVSTHVMYGIMLASVRVNGPVYDRISVRKDVISELMPPPTLEAYVLVIHFVQTQDPAQRKALVEKIEKREPDLDALQASWQTNMPPGAWKDA